MWTRFFSIALILFFVIDALGLIPTYLTLIADVPKAKRRVVTIRELLIALILMVLFQLIGVGLLSLLGIVKSTVQVAGGIVIFLISLHLIFSAREKIVEKWEAKEPFIVPLATPLIAGPSVLALIMIYGQEEEKGIVVISAIFAAWFVSALIFLAAEPLHRLLGEKGLLAAQRLMGLILSIIAIQMLLRGIGSFVKEGL